MYFVTDQEIRLKINCQFSSWQIKFNRQIKELALMKTTHNINNLFHFKLSKTKNIFYF